MIAEFSIIPVGKGQSLSADVAQVLQVVDESGLAMTVSGWGEGRPEVVTGEGPVTARPRWPRHDWVCLALFVSFTKCPNTT